MAPQVTATLYYWLPRASEALFGFSEVAYRLPSLLLMGVALFLIALLARRLIHPRAGWFAAFACLALRPFNYQAADARPYAMGTCVGAACVWFLVRWLDRARWSDGALFVFFGALLWRVHLMYWPFYVVLGSYALIRLARGETSVSRRRAAVLFALLGLALVPVLVKALAINREAATHVIAPLPSLNDLRVGLKLLLILQCGALAWALSRLQRPAREARSIAVDYFLPPEKWALASVLLAAAVLILVGQWREAPPRHDASDWRAAVVDFQLPASGFSLLVFAGVPPDGTAVYVSV